MIFLISPRLPLHKLACAGYCNVEKDFANSRSDVIAQSKNYLLTSQSTTYGTPNLRGTNNGVIERHMGAHNLKSKINEFLRCLFLYEQHEILPLDGTKTH